jgi:tRNA(fMet)-specific endonuclease VapC
MILNCDTETARLYGNVKNSLRKKGRPIPENDIRIAAAAFQHDLVPVSRDEHFEEVEGLKLEKW